MRGQLGMQVGYAETIDADPFYSYQIFTALGSNLASAAAQLGDLEATTAGTKSAEYVVIRTVNGVDRAFFLYAIRAEDGIWRLESM